MVRSIELIGLHQLDLRSHRGAGGPLCDFSTHGASHNHHPQPRARTVPSPQASPSSRCSPSLPLPHPLRLGTPNLSPLMYLM